MKRRAALIALVVLGAAATVLWAWSRDRADRGGYRTATIERGDLQSTVSSTGALEAVTTVSVGTQVSGIVAELDADFNDTVRKGQVIARLDPRVLETAVRDAEAEVARRRAELAQAEAAHGRSARLAAEQLISPSELDAAEQALAVAKANLDSATVGLGRARQNLDYATIRSPIDGTVIARSVDVGQTVAASLSAPELFRIAADLSKMQILVSVDESDIGQIRPGQSATFTVQAFPSARFEGRVSQVRLEPKTVENVVNYTVVVSADNDERRLLPGMTATVEFEVASAKDVLQVPNAALRFRPSEAVLAELRASRGGNGDDPARRGADGERPAGEATAGSGRMRGQGAAGLGAGGGPATAEGGAGGGRARPTVVWTIDASGNLHPLRVRTGLSDGQMTEVQGRDLQEGTPVVIGTLQTEEASASSPFTPNRQPRGPGRGLPGF